MDAPQTEAPRFDESRIAAPELDASPFVVSPYDTRSSDTPRHCTVTFAEPADGPASAERCEVGRFDVAAGQRVLHEMVRRNVRVVPVGCRGGGCGVCRVRVLDGEYEALRMSARHVSADDVAGGVVLACRIVPITDLVIELAPPSANLSTTSPTTTNIPTNIKE